MQIVVELSEEDYEVLKQGSTFTKGTQMTRVYEALWDATPLPEHHGWIPVSEQLPKENEYIMGVCKYYLIQDEYGDMHVAHLSNVGWIPIDSLKAIGDEVIAWMPLPLTYKEGEEK